MSYHRRRSMPIFADITGTIGIDRTTGPNPSTQSEQIHMAVKTLP
ncbi:hypothetical protein Poly59_25270 [Rubripirellula reticaptiva]|uniref:Uncharacterized protein n=1 Tax=Rubripirellula reticaptiva TaxID=2528013 RepID=A0A5C6F343_9BACT|nr:hypothetical protein Poly59_25270 [Rubripirellula reticaptiva]